MLSRKEIAEKQNKPDITGTFIFFALPGDYLKVTYREFEKEPIEKYKLQDMQQYKIPWGVAHYMKFKMYQTNYSTFEKKKYATFHFKCDCNQCVREFNPESVKTEEHSCADSLE